MRRAFVRAGYATGGPRDPPSLVGGSPSGAIQWRLTAMSSLTLNKITSQRGISVGEATKKISDLGWNPTYVQEAMTFPTDYKIAKAPRDPMKQVLRSYFPMQEEKDNRVYGALDPARLDIAEHVAAQRRVEIGRAHV